MVVCLILSGCKAQSELTITLENKTSGTVNFLLELDEPAASAIRSDSFDSKTLSQVFNTKKLQEAGFSVEITDNSNGDPSKIELKAKFENEKQLKNILEFFAPSDVLDIELDSTGSLFRERQTLEVRLDISRLRESYLEDEDVKNAIEESGIEFTEFESLINEAMSSTTLNLKLNTNSESKSAFISGDETSKEFLKVESDSIRTRYLLNIGFAILFGIAGISLFWRNRRTPKLLSSKEKETK